MKSALSTCWAVLVVLVASCSFSVDKPVFPGSDADAGTADGRGGQDSVVGDERDDPDVHPDAAVDAGPDATTDVIPDMGEDLVSGDVPQPDCKNHSDCDDLDDCTVDKCAAGKCVHEPVPGCAVCFPEGKEFEDPNPDGKCCAPTSPVAVSMEMETPCMDEWCWPGYTCEVPNCFCFVCVQCGDGKCGKGENRCNCPQDCEEPFPCQDKGGFCFPEPECPDGTQGIFPSDCGEGVCCKQGQKCAGAGQPQGVGPEQLPCCEGLFAIGWFDWEPSGECMAIPGGNICSACGNMVCEAWENPCNCQKDCGDGECIPEGKMYEGIYEFTPCCDDLQPVEYAEVSEDGECMFVNCLCFVCANCGNGFCGPGENFCNCPQDCGEEPPNKCQDVGGFCFDVDSPCPEGALMQPVEGCGPGQQCCIPSDPQCAKEGDKIPVSPEAPPCCAGLEPISTAYPSGGTCALPVGAAICAKCGDGVCKEAWENYCNCPGDCPESNQETCSKNGPFCPSGMYCQSEPGKCVDAAAPGACVSVPKICPEVYSPVCGCDGKTYGNQCEMESASMSKAYDGECKTECFSEGEAFEDFDLTGKCCAGLAVIEACKPSVDNKACLCEQGPVHVCSFCGNGKCGPGESWCNCPKDCTPPVGTTCEGAKGVCVPKDPLPLCPQGYFPLPIPGCNLPYPASCCLPK